MEVTKEFFDKLDAFVDQYGGMLCLFYSLIKVMIPV